MTISIWALGALVLLAALTAGVIVWLAVPEAETVYRETRTQYDRPDYNEKAGFAVTASPESEIILKDRLWLIENSVAELDFTIVPGRWARLRVARSGGMRYPAGFAQNAFESVEQYEIDGLQVRQYQNAGGLTAVSWTREDFDYLLYAEEPEMNMIAGLTVPFVSTTRAKAG